LERTTQRDGDSERLNRVIGPRRGPPAFGVPNLSKQGSDVHTQITRDENYHDDDADDVEDHCFHSGYARDGDSLPRSIRRSFERPPPSRFCVNR
jgi:hypothetical protein